MTTKPGVGPTAKVGPTLTREKALTLKPRNDHCPRCQKRTRQGVEVNDGFQVCPCYSYRCDDCQCIVESGALAQQTKRRAPNTQDDAPKKVRRPRED